MDKRKISLLIILFIILFTIPFPCFPVVKALTESYSDPPNDIFRIDYQNEVIEKVSSHDEIDIINIFLDEQYTNITFAGNITEQEMECNIYFFENYNQSNVIFEYGVHYSNLTGTGYKVIFVKYNRSGEDDYNYEFWNNTIGWTSSNISADIIGNSSDYFIEAEIPEDALILYDNITWFAISRYYEGYNLFLDCAPDSYCPVKETNVNFMNQIFLFIGIAVIVGVAAIIYYKKKKPQDEFSL